MNRRLSRNKQRGFSLTELAVYIAIATILAVAALAGIASYRVSGRVPTAAAELQRGMQRLAINADGQGATPYATLTTDSLCNILRGGAVVTTAGTGSTATCTHSLTAFGSGAVTAEPGTLAATGDSMQISVAGVSNFACPDFAATMQRAVAVISINGTEVKAANGRLDIGAAAAACTLLDTNTFVFTGA
jgi:prepilin-type N-terminal cleavage/methylation domain-containing protein